VQQGELAGHGLFWRESGKPNLLGKNTHLGYLVQKAGGRNEKDYRIFDVGSFD
jgi:hypothetical protein